MDIVVGKYTAKLHTSMNGEVQTSIGNKNHEGKGVRKRKDSTINKNNHKYL